MFLRNAIDAIKVARIKACDTCNRSWQSYVCIGTDNTYSSVCNNSLKLRSLWQSNLLLKRVKVKVWKSKLHCLKTSRIIFQFTYYRSVGVSMKEIPNLYSQKWLSFPTNIINLMTESRKYSLSKSLTMTSDWLFNSLWYYVNWKLYISLYIHIRVSLNIISYCYYCAILAARTN